MGDSLRATEDDLRRLVAAEWWRWLPGMLVDHHVGPMAAIPVRLMAPFVPFIGLCAGEVSDFARPIVSDHGTAGCLQELYFDRYAAEHEGATRRQALQSLAGIYNIDEYASMGDVLAKALLEVGVCWTYRPEGNPLIAKQHPACSREDADAGLRSTIPEPESSTANPSSGRAPR